MGAAVGQAFDRILAYWLDRGVAGFRIDVCNMIIKDAELRDNPPALDSDPLDVRIFGQRPEFNSDRPEVHGVLRRWRSLADRYPGRVLLGETPVPTMDSLARYYGDGTDELHLAFNFPFLTAPFEAEALREIVEASERALPDGAWPVWTGSNHDLGRLATRWAGGDRAKARAALVVLLCLRGTPVLYQGDELGLVDTEVPHEAMQDPLGIAYYPHWAGRDGCRTPMPWRDGPGGGFTGADVPPWLPLGDTGSYNLGDQRDDADSTVNMVRELIDLRRREPALHGGPYRSLAAPPDAWAWRRGASLTVVVNMSDDGAAMHDVEGTVLFGTERRRRGESVDGELRVGRWEAVVVDTGTAAAPVR